MTVTYSLEVSNTRFCGFVALLCRWKASIYKIVWKELILFLCLYYALNQTYWRVLNDEQKRLFERVSKYCEYTSQFVPLSFVLGFYVTVVIGRWWEQYLAIPWPDRTAIMISSTITGSDERSRVIRRTLARYLLLLHVFTCQAVSTAVKKRFPSLYHLLEVGSVTPGPEDCSQVLQAVNRTCPKNSWFNTCTYRCPNTCSLENRQCAYGCCEGCTCDSGYVMHDTEHKCVNKTECPDPCTKVIKPVNGNCTINSSYNACANKCPATCGSKTPPSPCTSNPCCAGCQCNENYVQKGNQCVLKGDCNKAKRWFFG